MWHFPYIKKWYLLIPFGALIILLWIFFRPPSQQKANISYTQDVQPILASKCYACHGPDEAKREAGLRLDERGALFTVLESGHAVVSETNPEESEIINRITSEDNEVVMPPPDFGKKLEPEEKDILVKWIKNGVAWEDHWSYSHVSPVDVPKTEGLPENWNSNPIDRLIYTKLKEKGLSPSAEANKITLIKRLKFDLHGLPPTPEEVEEFMNDKSPDAYEKLVDKLLSSPHYGERWARHWLDIAHYGDSHGFDKDKRRANAWPYRDYVIDALNKDIPYSRFVEDQIAGDVLYPGNPGSTIALGFLAAGPWDFVGHVEVHEGTVEKRSVRNLDRDDILTNTFSTFSSLTVQCARCHDHKFDPIQQKDYYNLQAVFAGIDRADRPFDRDPEIHKLRSKLLGKKEEISRKLQSLENPETGIRAVEISSNNESAFLKFELENINNRLDSLPDPEYVYAASTSFPPQANFRPANGIREVFLLNRGDTEQPLEKSVPGALEILPELKGNFNLPENHREGERRAALAKWLTDKDNSFTWRSIVNRIWQYHLGTGIVATPNDFGKMGVPPSHPELLDYLANQFIENGESFKWLHRQILTSATYKQSSFDNAENRKIDGNNRYYWRANRKVKDAEALRDGVLAISGKLDLKKGGPGFDVFKYEDDHSPRYLYTEFDHTDSSSFRRSIYRSVIRSVPDPFMSTLDCADPSQSVPVRNESVTALQALSTLNNPFMIRQANYFSERLRKISSNEDTQIEKAFELALLRKPREDEFKECKTYVSEHGLASMCRLIFAMNEFLYID